MVFLGEREEVKKTVSVLMFGLLFVSVLTFALNIEPAKSWTGGTITILSDGSIDPSDAPIQRNGNLYTLTGNISTNNVNGIVIERDDIVIDGAGYTLQGIQEQETTGIVMFNRINVEIRRIRIEKYDCGIQLTDSNYNNITGNIIVELIGMA